MTSEQEAIFNMQRAANQIGLDNAVYIATIPMMDTMFTELNTRINTISGLISLQTSVLSGIAIDKKNLKETMALQTFNYAGPGRAWAASNNDDTTFEALNVSESRIKREEDDVAGPMCQAIYNILNTNSTALVPFGLSAPMLLELNNTITDYIAIVPLPNNAVNLRQTYTSNIDEQVKDTSEFLERQLDNVVRGQISASPDFVSNYFNARVVNDPPVHSTTFKIKVSEASNGNAMLNARAEAVGTNQIAFTDINGFCELKKFPKGTYTILVSATGFVPQQQIVPIGLGETIELIFSLSKV